MECWMDRVTFALIMEYSFKQTMWTTRPKVRVYLHWIMDTNMLDKENLGKCMEKVPYTSQMDISMKETLSLIGSMAEEYYYIQMGTNTKVSGKKGSNMV